MDYIIAPILYIVNMLLRVERVKQMLASKSIFDAHKVQGILKIEM